MIANYRASQLVGALIGALASALASAVFGALLGALVFSNGHWLVKCNYATSM